MNAAPRIYETAADRAREESIAARVAAAWGCDRQIKCEFSQMDRELWRGEAMVARIEIKVRSLFRESRAFYSISAAKISVAVALWEWSGVRSFLVVQFRDGLFFVPVTRLLMAWVKVGGRRDRGDARDTEPCAVFPVAWFRPVEGVEHGRG